MTDIEQKALALVNEVRAEDGYTVPITYDWFNTDSFEHHAFLRAIEQHEAFRQEVSDAVEDCLGGRFSRDKLARFIIAKPDPLVEVMNEMGFGWSKTASEEFRAAIEKRGGKIIFNEE